GDAGIFLATKGLGCTLAESYRGRRLDADPWSSASLCRPGPERAEQTAASCRKHRTSAITTGYAGHGPALAMCCSDRWCVEPGEGQADEAEEGRAGRGRPGNGGVRAELPVDADPGGADPAVRSGLQRLG